MTTNATRTVLSRRTALAGLGACGLGLAAVSLLTMPMRLLAQQATPDPAETAADLIRETERERLRSLVDADLDVAGRLHADDFQLINPSGGVLSKEEYLGAIAAGEIDCLVFEPDSAIAVPRLHGETAVIRYQSRLEIVVGGRRGSPPRLLAHRPVRDARRALAGPCPVPGDRNPVTAINSTLGAEWLPRADRLSVECSPSRPTRLRGILSRELPSQLRSSCRCTDGTRGRMLIPVPSLSAS